MKKLISLFTALFLLMSALPHRRDRRKYRTCSRNITKSGRNFRSG